jgi:hypothetical protein
MEIACPLRTPWTISAQTSGIENGCPELCTYIKVKLEETRRNSLRRPRNGFTGSFTHHLQKVRRVSDRRPARMAAATVAVSASIWSVAQAVRAAFTRSSVQ